jgi:hypothetical protein
MRKSRYGGGGFFGIYGGTGYNAYSAGGGSGFVYNTPHINISLSSNYYLSNATTNSLEWNYHGQAIITPLQPIETPSPTRIPSPTPIPCP